MYQRQSYTGSRVYRFLWEADVSDGLPVFEMVGFLASEVQEAKKSAYSIEKLRLCPASKAYYDQFYACEYQKNPVPGLTFRLRWQSLPHSGISDRKWSGIFCSGRGWTEWKSTTGKWNFANGGGGKKRKRNEKMYGSMEKCRRGGIGIGHAGICRKKILRML